MPATHRTDFTLRADIAAAITRGFSFHDPELAPRLNPDAVHAVADEVIAVRMAALTGYAWVAEHHPRIIGPAIFTNDGELYGWPQS